MIKKLLLTVLTVATLNAQEEPKKNVDCLILKDENSIICKYETIRKDRDENIMIHWIDPNGELSRTREMTVPAGHASIYDFRYIKNRALGTWTFKVMSGDEVHTTTFDLK